VDRDGALPAALCPPHSEQSPGQVDVVPFEPKKLAPSQSRVRHERQQQSVALWLAREVALPEVVARRLGEQALELAHRQRVREGLALLRRPQRQRRIAHDSLLLDEEAKEQLQRRRRPRLARDGRPALLLFGKESAQVGDPNLRQIPDPLTLQVSQTRRNVTLVCRAGRRGKPALGRAKAQEIGQFVSRAFVHRSSSGQPSDPRWSEPEDYPAYRPATGKPRKCGVFPSYGVLLCMTGTSRDGWRRATAQRSRPRRGAIPRSCVQSSRFVVSRDAGTSEVVALIRSIHAMAGKPVV
jgi:hypothetical protein